MGKITVYGAGDDNKVALWDGDTFVVNDGKAYTVEETATVKRAIAEKRLSTERPRGYGGKPQAAAANPVPELRPATEEEEDRAGLTGTIEKKTAVVRNNRT